MVFEALYSVNIVTVITDEESYLILFFLGIFLFSWVDEFSFVF